MVFNVQYDLGCAFYTNGRVDSDWMDLIAGKKSFHGVFPILNYWVKNGPHRGHIRDIRGHVGLRDDWSQTTNGEVINRSKASVRRSGCDHFVRGPILVRQADMMGISPGFH